MKSKVILYLGLLVCLIFLSAGTFAQLRHPGQGNTPDQRQKLESYKIAFLTEKLSLTPQEAQKFWPVYNEYQAKKQNLQKSLMGKYKDYRLSKDATDKQAQVLIDSTLIQMQVTLDLTRDYYGKLKGILPPEKILALFSAERQFRRVLLQRLAGRDQRDRRDR